MFVLRTVHSKTVSGLGRGRGSQQTRGFLGAILSSIRERFAQDKELKSQIDQLKKHVDDSPDLKVRIDAAKDVADKMKAGAQVVTSKTKLGLGVAADVTGKVLKTTAGALADAGSKVGDTYSQTAAAAGVSRAKMAGKQMVDAVRSTSVAQTVNRLVTTAKEDLTREGKIFPDLQLPPPPAAEPAPEQPEVEQPQAQTQEQTQQGPSDVMIRDQTFGQRTWQLLKELEHSKNPLLRGTFVMTNKLADTFSAIGDRVFSESELGKVVREAKTIDPQFSIEAFMRHARTVVPQVVKAFNEGNDTLIKQYSSGGALNQMRTHLRLRREAGLKMDAKLLDLHSIEMHNGKLDNDRPLFIVTFTMQQSVCIRNVKGEIVEGNVDNIRSQTCAWIFSFAHSTVDEPGGWKVFDMATIQDQSTW
eukprot:TRINITY_DN778_c0_g1_i10.p2 TRINITY_DN778_c0_g1~~TRINITY_DN778_c0_g1_i10.p2  ORF type:complete len:417 (+),score=104.37 TRINITY_DN778_c0_g1_i10:6435-7685(+)